VYRTGINRRKTGICATIGRRMIMNKVRKGMIKEKIFDK
jgi:hypothetical protein